MVVDFVQLDDEHVRGLHDTLWSLLGRSDLSKMVKTQLALAMAALAVQSEQVDIVGPTLHCLMAANADNDSTLLSLLAFIPEQLDNRQIVAPRDAYDRQRRRLVEAHAEAVMQLLLSRLLTTGHALHGQLIACMLAWVKHGGAARFAADAQFLRVLFGFLEAHESVGELISELVYWAGKGDATDAWLETLGDAIRAVLIPLIQRKLGECEGDNRLGEGDVEMRSFVSVLADAGEQFLGRLFTKTAPALTASAVLEGILLAMRCRSFAVVELSLSFWEALAQHVESAGSEQLRDAIAPFFARLFRQIVLLYLPYPEEQESLSSDEMHAFRDFRHVIGDCLKDCTRVLGGSTSCLLVVEMMLGGGHGSVDDLPSIAASDVQSALASSLTAGSSWKPVEAALFALRVTASAVDRRESEVLPALLPALLHIPRHPRLVYAVLLVIGCYADWLAVHTEVLLSHPLLAFVATGFADAASIPAAAVCLRWLGESCGPILARPAFLADMLHLYSTSIERLSADDAVELVAAIGNVLEHVNDDGPVKQVLSYPLSLLASSGKQQHKALRLLDQLLCSCRPRAVSSPLISSVVESVHASMPLLLHDRSLVEPLISLLRTLILALYGEEDRRLPVGSCEPVMAVIVQDCQAMLVAGITPACYVLRTALMHAPQLTPSLLPLLHFASTMPLEETDDFLAMMTAAVDYSPTALPEDLLRCTTGVTRRTLQRLDSSLAEQRQALAFLSHSLVPLPSDALAEAVVHRLPAALMADVAHLACRLPLDSAASFFRSLIAILPPSFSDRERATLWQESESALRSPSKVRDLKGVLTRISTACGRRAASSADLS